MVERSPQSNSKSPAEGWSQRHDWQSLKSVSLQSSALILKPFGIDDVDDEYQSWLSDPEINRFMEVRHFDHSFNSLVAYAESVATDPCRFFYKIEFSNAPNRKIGTASLSVNRIHGYANYGYMVGDKRHWGATVALQVQVVLFDFAFNRLALRKLIGGAYEGNVPSLFNFRRLGFVREGVRRQHVLGADGLACDVHEFGLLADEWRSAAHKYDRLRATSPAQPKLS